MSSLFALLPCCRYDNRNVPLIIIYIFFIFMKNVICYSNLLFRTRNEMLPLSRCNTLNDYVAYFEHYVTFCHVVNMLNERLLLFYL